MIYLLAVLLVVAAITFVLMRAVPGGPFDQDKPLPAEVKANIEKRYGLDQPLIVQFGRYLNDVMIPWVTT